MLLGSPGACQAQSHTLRPNAPVEDLRSAGPKRERKEGWGGAVRHSALHNGEQRSAAPRLLEAAGGRWEEAMGAAHAPPSSAGGENPGEQSGQTHAGQGLRGRRHCDEQRPRRRHARGNANRAEAPGAASRARGRGTDCCPVPPAGPAPGPAPRSTAGLRPLPAEATTK